MLDLSKISFKEIPQKYSVNSVEYRTQIIGKLILHSSIFVEDELFKEMSRERIYDDIKYQIWSYVYGDLINLVMELQELALKNSQSFDSDDKILKVENKINDLLNYNKNKK